MGAHAGHSDAGNECQPSIKLVTRLSFSDLPAIGMYSVEKNLCFLAMFKLETFLGCGSRWKQILGIFFERQTLLTLPHCIAIFFSLTATLPTPYPHPAIPTFPTWQKYSSLILSSNGFRKMGVISWVVFSFLDILDIILCNVYKLLDEILEGKTSPSSYCWTTEEKKIIVEDGVVDPESKLSETLHGRRNSFRDLMGSNGIPGGSWSNGESAAALLRRRSGNKWSDCGCDSCVEWMMQNSKDLRLHVVVQEPQNARLLDDKEKDVENVIFLHGFLSSSSFWTETVFPNLSESVKRNHRLFAVDLLGFGRSPKPGDCFYTLRDHMEMIEKSVIREFQLDSFHLVAHSMGCVIALALAAERPNSIKSISLISPPYFSSNETASLVALERLAGRGIWPPLLFGSAVMSWYEHLGRCVCLVVCRNHKLWETLLKLITRKRELHFMVMDLTRHTHHSAWHSMHNVICGGAKLMNSYLETLREARVKIDVVQGTRDQVVPIECSINLKNKVTEAELNIIPNADHISVVLGREMDFTRDLESVWAAVADFQWMAKK